MMAEATPIPLIRNLYSSSALLSFAMIASAHFSVYRSSPIARFLRPETVALVGASVETAAVAVAGASVAGALVVGALDAGTVVAGALVVGALVTGAVVGSPAG